VRYNMDGVGNRTSVVDDGKVTTYATNSVNEYVYVGNQRLMYDRNGNMTSDGNLQMFYDHNNMLVEIRTEQYVFHQRFDAIGRRLMVQFSDGLMETRYFWHDGQQVIYEEVSGLTEPYRYVWGNGIDEALVRFGNGGIWYLDNQLGSVMGLTDSSGQIVERYSYDVYGAVTAYDSSGQQIPVTNYDNRYLFTGREYNWHTGLYHYRARTYHPQLGRFLSRDPAEILAYEYCKSSPTMSVDPTGAWAASGHRVLTKEPLWKVGKSIGLSDYKLMFMEDILVEANLSQDKGQAYYQLYRHYNRAMGQKRIFAWGEYLLYVSDEISLFEQRTSEKRCAAALEALGRLLHSFQDFFAHAYHPRHGIDAWTAVPPARGTPMNNDDLWPCSYDWWGSFRDEHETYRELRVSDREFRTRFEDAKRNTEKWLKKLLPRWLKQCNCWLGKGAQELKQELERFEEFLKGLQLRAL